MSPVELKSEIKKIVYMVIEENMQRFESRINAIDGKLQSLESRVGQNTYGSEHQARVMKLVEDAYADMDHARQVYCSDDDEDGLILVIIHDDEDFGRAFEEACARARKLEELLPDTYIEPHILHKSEADPYHTSGTKIVFER